MTYYDRYWLKQLPADASFNAHPTWTEDRLKQSKAWADKWTDPKKMMLDYGCGTGGFTNYINAIGTDISQVALNKAKETYPDTGFCPIPDLGGTFGTVFLFDVLEHIVDFDELFDILNKRTGKGTRLLITTNENSLTKMFVIMVLFFDYFFHPYSPHIRFFTKESLKKLLESKGYKVIHYERLGNYLGLISKGQFIVAERE